MPFKDLEKRKEYYRNHKRHYDKEWINKNKFRWNAYQSNYKRKQRLKVAESIKRGLIEINLAEENSMTFKAAVLFLLIGQTGILHFGSLKKRTGYLLDEIRFIFANWKKYKIFKDGKFYLDEPQNPLHETTEVTLIAMCGAGILARTTVEIDTPEPTIEKDLYVPSQSYYDNCRD